MIPLAKLLRVVGLILIILVAFPVYHILPWSEIGRSGRDIVRDADRARELMLLGSLILVGIAIIASRLISPVKFDGWIQRVAAAIQKPRTRTFVLVLALISAALTLAFSQLVLHGKPNLIDGMAQLLHARYIVEGFLAAPDVSLLEHWMIQNSVVTPHGWVSQYPPGFPILLATGMSIGAVWIIPPLLVAITVFFTTLAAHRLLADRIAVARVGAILVALNPLMIGLAGAYMNHIAASAFIAFAIYAATKDELKWNMLAGLAVALTFSVRPLSGVVAAVVVVAIWWLYHGETGATTGSIFAALGGSFVIGLLAKYNSYLFGSPFRFGYMVSDGEATNLGFHRDPWGNWYGIKEAISYTSTDLTTLSWYLVHSVLPVVIVCGLFLLFARKISKGEIVISFWALAGSIALFFYWHHGIFMGPRMLADFAPAWALFFAVSAAGIVQMLPSSFSFKGYSPRVAVGTALAVSVGAGILYLAPERLINYGADYMISSRISIPKLERPALVFVHGGWSGRIAARLLARGMRRDSVETAMRYNTTCKMHGYALGGAVDLNLTQQGAEELPKFDFTPGNMIRVVKGEVPTAACRRELASDRFGIVDIPPMLWQETLAGLPGDSSGVIVLRDLGPEANQKALAKYPDRQPLVFTRPSPNAAPILMPYDRGMAALWSL